MADLVAVEQRCVRSHALVFGFFFSSFFCLVWKCLLGCLGPGLRVGRSVEEGGGKLETGEQLAEKKKKPLHHLLPG